MPVKTDRGSCCRAFQFFIQFLPIARAVKSNDWVSRNLNIAYIKQSVKELSCGISSTLCFFNEIRLIIAHLYFKLNFKFDQYTLALN